MTALVTEHLPLVAGAPEGTRKLRELILELAVRGKLVEQDPTDEAAQELLERIAVKRATHSKVAKSIAPLSDEDLTYPLPLGWAWTRLASQVYESGAGWSPSCEARPKTGDEWGVLKVSAVSWGRFSPDENKALPASLVPRPEHQVTVGDFLVSRANTSDLVARSVVVEATAPRLMLSDKIVRLKLTPDCCARYINLVNTCPASRRYYGLVAGGTSSSMKNVSREQILHLPLPLPPLAEQHRIVAKVDELMALCDRLEADQADAEAAHAQLVQALLDSLTQATNAADFRAHWQRLSEHFHTLFTTEASIDALKEAIRELAIRGALTLGIDAIDDWNAATKNESDLFAIPRDWNWVTLDNLVLDLRYGTSTKCSYEYSGTPVLRIPNVGEKLVTLDDLKYGDLSEEERQIYALKEGDILMIRSNGSASLVGRAAIVGAEAAKCAFAGYLVRIRLPRDRVTPEYFQMALGACHVRCSIEGPIRTTSGVKNINSTEIRGLQIPLPSLPMQHRIVAKVDELMALCDQLKTQLADARQQHAQLATALIEQAVA